MQKVGVCEGETDVLPSFRQRQRSTMFSDYRTHGFLNIYGICMADGYDLECLFLRNNYFKTFFP